MADIDIELEKKSTTDINATAQFETYGEVIEFDSEDDLYTSGTQTNIELNPECIEIEITGLKTIDAFIGLTDTPLYYENGKFFKVQDNKIIYTDITWADVVGEISENPVLEEQVKEIAKLYSEQFVKDTVDKAIDIHNQNADSHKLIQDIITDNYTKLDNKIDINTNELTNSLELLEVDVVKNTEDINTLFAEQAKDVENIANINTNISNINESINHIHQDIIDMNINIDTNTDNISNLTNKTEENYNSLNSLIQENISNINKNNENILEVKQNLSQNYTPTSEFSEVAFSGDYNSLINTPNIPSLEGYATTEYVDSKLDETIAQIEKFDFIIVEELPEIGESNHIYLVKHVHDESDVYDEYIWVQSIQGFEKIGNTDLDLSDYYTKSEVNENLDKKVDKLEGYSLISDSEIERLASVDNYDDTEIKELINTKQDSLTAGENISITQNEETNELIISAIDTVYTAGEGISIEDNVITNTNISAEWGNIVGDINTQTDLQDVLNSKIDTDIFEQEISKKQDILTAGEGIDISDNTISGTTIIFRNWSV